MGAAPPQMSPVSHKENEQKRHSFASGWTGATTVALFVYVALAILLTFVDSGGSRVLELVNLYSDSPPSIVATILAGAAAFGSSDPAARRTWWLLTAALGCYSIGNVSHATYWLFDLDPFPSIGDVFFLAFYPLVIAAALSAIRSAAVRVPWARLGLDAAILLLGFGGFFWFFVIEPTAAAQQDPDVLRYALAQAYIALNCLVLLACAVLLMHAHSLPIPRRSIMLLTLGFASMSIADIVWAMSKVGGSYLPGGVSDAMYLSCYVWLAAAAREQLRGTRAARRAPGPLTSAALQGIPYLTMPVAFIVLVAVESSTASSPANLMTATIFVLTSLVMLRQGVISRDEALLRERRAAGLVEARYASLIRNASDVIMIADADGRLRFASPAAERTFAMHPDDLVGRNLLELLADADRDRLASFLAEVAATEGRAVGPVEAVIETGERRSTLECVGSNLSDDPAIAGLALNFRDVSERKVLEEQLRNLAFHDHLTLLANRSLFWNRVEHALALSQRTRQRVAVMFLDLDNFKNVNDTLGHDAGDRLLQAVAQRLVKSTRPSDTVARLGGDEFAILLEDVRRLLAPRGGCRATAAQRRHRHVQRQGLRQVAAGRVRGAHAGTAARPPAPRAGDRPRAGAQGILPRVPAGRGPEPPRAARRRGPVALAAPAARHRHARRVHLDRRGIRAHRRDRPPGAPRRVHAGPPVERCAHRRRRPARRREHLGPAPAAG